LQTRTPAGFLMPQDWSEMHPDTPIFRRELSAKPKFVSGA